MREKLQEEAKKTVFSSGFEEETSECHSVNFCSVYPKDAANYLREPIWETLYEKSIHRSREVQDFSHAMNAEVVTNESPAVARLVKSSKDMSHSWKITESVGMKFYVGCHQIFCNKSQVLLSAGDLQFYQLHVTL